MKIKMSMNSLRTVQLLLLFSIVVWNPQCHGIKNNFLESFKKPETFELSIIHMNDFHARFEEVNEAGWPCKRHINKKCFGGLPRTLTVARQLKNDQPNSIFLNAGDHYQGTIWYNIHKWKATAEFFNMLPNDVMTIGNHEFDNGIAGLIPFLQHINVPVVLSNIITKDESSLQKLIRKSYIIEKGGRKIGIIGVIFHTVWKKTNTGDIWFLKEIDTINSEAKQLKEQNVDIIIVLSHCGIEIDRNIAAECPDVDVIVGGHSHTFLYTGPTSPPHNVPEDKYPVVVTQNGSGRTVLIVQAFAFTKYLGHLSVEFDENGEVQFWKGAPILLDESVEEDKEMLQRLEPYKNTVIAKCSEVVGVTLGELKNDCRYTNCPLSNLITDAMVASYINQAEGSDWTYAAIAITYGRSIKEPIKPVNGMITYGDLLMTLPFEDTWDVIEVEGQHLRQALEESFTTSSWRGQRKYHTHFVWSGIDIVYDTSISALSKIVDIKVRCQKCQQPIYEDLEDHRWYRIVMPGFIVRNGGDSTIARKHLNHVRGPVDVDQLKDFIRAMSPLNYKRDVKIYFCDRSRNKLCGQNYRSHKPRQSIFPDLFITNFDNVESHKRMQNNM